MGLFELFLVAVGLSMDAFAVSICKGLATPKLRPRHLLVVGLWFGGFQALMPLLGYFLGAAFQRYITAVDHWVAFVLLALIGGNMIREAFSPESEAADCSLSVKVMAPMAIATSIDALAVGVTFALLPDVADSPGGGPHRRHDLRPLGFGRQGRPRLRRQVSGQGRIRRRRNPGPPGPENPAGAPGHPGITDPIRP